MNYLILCNGLEVIAAVRHEEDRDSCLEDLVDLYPELEFTKMLSIC